MKNVKAPLSYLDPDFVQSKEGRPLRILSEYLDPERKLKLNNIEHTVVFFGSARTKPDSSDPLSFAYNAAEDLAYNLAKWSSTIEDPSRKIYICTGGGPGAMEAANKGAARAGEKTIGLNIALPFEQEPNPYISPELNMEFHYFYMRKLWFLYHSKAIIVFPGGFGTMDELFETLTLIQTKKIDKPHLPVLLYNKKFWESLINFDIMKDNGLISPEDLNLFRYFDTTDEAMKILVPEITELVDNYSAKNFF
ncbi:MAG TPA: LOG family protein [Spirochaetota bacterium]|nr:LOG family protein [Spirochaetota bacterium]